MEYRRTPDSAFADIGFDFDARYVDVVTDDGTALRLHYIDEGPRDGEVILCLHGQPSWSYLYRKLVAPLTAAGFRVVAPDLIGFGKSDKPMDVHDYSYRGHVDWMQQFVTQLDLTDINGLFQDWGGMIGMRLVERDPDRYRRVIVANTMLLDTADVPSDAARAIGSAFETLPIPSAEDVRDAFAAGDPMAGAIWVKYATRNPRFSVTDVIATIAGKSDLAALDGYRAPFPDRTYMVGAIAFPLLFPIMEHHEAERRENARIWKWLHSFSKPFMTAFSDGDPVTRAFSARFRETIPGAASVPHVTVRDAGHYLFDEQPDAIAEAIRTFTGRGGAT